MMLDILSVGCSIGLVKYRHIYNLLGHHIPHFIGKINRQKSEEHQTKG